MSLSLQSNCSPHCLLIISYISLSFYFCPYLHFWRCHPLMFCWSKSDHLSRPSLCCRCTESFLILTHYQSFSLVDIVVLIVYIMESSLLYIKHFYSQVFSLQKDCVLLCSVTPPDIHYMPSSSSHIELVFNKYLLIDGKYS